MDKIPKSIRKLLKDLANRMNLTKDYVIEEGESGIWTYRKWKSGKAELWGTSPIYTVNINLQLGSDYYCNNAIPPQSFPFEFEEIPRIYFSPNQNGAVFYWLVATTDGSNPKATTKATGSLVAIRPNTFSNVKLSAHFYVVEMLKDSTALIGEGIRNLIKSLLGGGCYA